MVLFYFLLVFFGVMACGHYLGQRTSTPNSSQLRRDRPLQPLIEHCQQPHGRDAMSVPGIAKKG